MSSETPPDESPEDRGRLISELAAAEMARISAQERLLRRRLAAAEEQVRVFSALAARQQSLLEQFQTTRLWTLTRRWRRFRREFLQGSPAQRREVLRALRRLVTRSAGVLGSRSRVGPREAPAAPTVGDSAPDLPGAAAANGPFALLVFPAVPWSGRFQRPQQLARCFARDGRLVVYLRADFATAPRGASYQEVASLVEVEQVEDRLYEARLVATSGLGDASAGPVIYRTAIEDPDDLRYLQWSLRAVQQQLGYATTLSLISLPFWGRLALSLPDNWAVYDCLDEHSGFVTNSPVMLASETDLTARADMLVVTSHRLAERLRRTGRECVLIPNGCDYDHFAVEPGDLPAELSRLSGPIIGYYGAIADWFDTQVVAGIARARQDWNLVLIGHTRFANLRPLQGLANVHLLGEKPYTDLPGYASHFDVAVIPFRTNSLTLSTNPVKAYEYLALGKPVVSSPLAELQHLGGLTRLAGSTEEFVQAIEQALKENGPDAVASRRCFASQNTWQHRYQALSAAVKRQAIPRVSVLLVTYNKWQMTRECLESLLRHSHYPELEIVVVDNLSTDQTREELAKLEQTHGLRVVLNPENLGFAAGCNIAAKAASGEVLVFLNNDTVVRPGWLRGLLARLFDGEVGMVGPLTDSAGNDQTLGILADQPPAAVPVERVDLVLLDRLGRTREKRDLGFFCVAMRREVYDQVGPLDEGFSRGLFEDDDYCLRVRNAGYRLVVAEDVFVHHSRGASFSQLQHAAREQLWEANRTRFEQKHGQPWRRPAQPFQAQLRDLSPSEIARLLSDLGMPVVMAAPAVDFWAPWGKSQQLSRACARRGMMVLHFTGNRKHDRVDRFEEFDYNLLLVSEVADLREVTFDLLLVDPGVESRVLESLRCDARADINSVPEACDFDHFSTPVRGWTLPELGAIVDLGKPLVGWVDDGLAAAYGSEITAAAAAMPEVSFIAVGPKSDERRDPPNLHRIGHISYADMPQFAQALGTAIVAPTSAPPRWIARVSMWDYLASGTCVVAMDGAHGIPGVFGTEEGRLAESIREALRATRDRSLVAAMLREAGENTWEIRAREILRGVAQQPRSA